MIVLLHISTGDGMRFYCSLKSIAAKWIILNSTLYRIKIVLHLRKYSLMKNASNRSLKHRRYSSFRLVLEKFSFRARPRHLLSWLVLLTSCRHTTGSTQLSQPHSLLDPLLFVTRVSSYDLVLYCIITDSVSKVTHENNLQERKEKRSFP
jgi:hypothetical protein